MKDVLAIDDDDDSNYKKLQNDPILPVILHDYET
jgi:hypothetical protein